MTDWCTRTATCRPGLGSQRDLPVDPGGLAPGVALRHLPHADQRVGPAPQHQLLQVPDLGPVLLLRRLEDPLPQPPYLLLLRPPVDLVPLGGRVAGPVLRSVRFRGPPSPRPSQGRPTGRPPIPGWRSCNPSSRLTCPSVPAILAASLHQLTCLTSARFRARAPGPVSGQLCSAPGGRTGHDGAGFLLPFGRRHSLLGHPVPPGDSAPLTIGLPRRRRRRGPERGFHVPHA